MIILKKSFGLTVKNRQWLHVVSPTEEDLQVLINEHEIERELLLDALDPDELSRLELMENGRMVIMRLPTFNSHATPMYNAIPFGVFILENILITICDRSLGVIDDVHFRGPKIDDSSNLSFILSILLRSNFEYLRYLKEIKRRSELMETSMLSAVSSKEIIDLLTIDKSLQYISTSLRSNELLVEKLQKARYWNWGEIENELLEDVLIENKEASEIAHMYSNILKRLTSAYSIAMNNNLNHIMKRLAAMAFLLMIPTGVASVYGMNVVLPFENSPQSFAMLMGGSLFVVIIAYYILKKRKYF